MKIRNNLFLNMRVISFPILFITILICNTNIYSQSYFGLSATYNPEIKINKLLEDNDLPAIKSFSWGVELLHYNIDINSMYIVLAANLSGGTQATDNIKNVHSAINGEIHVGYSILNMNNFRLKSGILIGTGINGLRLYGIRPTNHILLYPG